MYSSTDPPGFTTTGAAPPTQCSQGLVGQSFFLFERDSFSTSHTSALMALCGESSVGSDFDHARSWVRSTGQGLLESAQQQKVRTVRRRSAASLAAYGAWGIATTAVQPLSGTAAMGAAVQRLSRYRAAGRVTSFSFDHAPELVPWHELRRVSCTKQWVREDPVTRLPPGTTRTKSVKLTIGLSTTESRDVSFALGLKASVSGVEVGPQVNQRLGFSLINSQQSESTETITLTNDRPDGYRRFALWHQEYVVHVDSARWSDGAMLWDPCSSARYVPDGAISVTSDDPPGGRPAR